MSLCRVRSAVIMAEKTADRELVLLIWGIIFDGISKNNISSFQDYCFPIERGSNQVNYI